MKKNIYLFAGATLAFGLLALAYVNVSKHACTGCHHHEAPAIATLLVKSPSFMHEEAIPKQFTGDDLNISPALAWDNIPPQTKSLALICDDPDATEETFVHWVLFNIPATTHKLEENIERGTKEFPNGMKQGVNDFNEIGYGGPFPPEGHGKHRYFFKLYALDKQLSLNAGATKFELEKAMQGNIIGTGTLIGTYQRNK